MKMLAANTVGLPNSIFHRVQGDSQWTVPLLIETYIENSTKGNTLVKQCQKKITLSPDLHTQKFIRYDTNYTLCNIGQIVLDLSWCQSSETLRVADADFNVVTAHLSLEAFLQGKNGSVDGIIQLQVFIVSFLKECFPINEVLAHGCGFPGEVSPRGIALEQVWPI